MGKRFIISEEQYNRALKEGVTLNADVDATNGDVKRAVTNTKREAQQSGVNLDNAKIQVNANDVNEGVLIKKQDLEKNRLKMLKENSELYTVKDFLKKITGN
jgi:hypothetical protein